MCHRGTSNRNTDHVNSLRFDFECGLVEKRECSHICEYVCEYRVTRLICLIQDIRMAACTMSGHGVYSQEKKNGKRRVVRK